MTTTEIPADRIPVGSVQLLDHRVYPLDPETADHMRSTSVVVEPGIYPVYLDGDAIYWILTGRINARGPRRIGDGLLAAAAADVPVGPELMFPSRRLGPDEFAALLADPACTLNHPDERLRFDIRGGSR